MKDIHSEKLKRFERSVNSEIDEKIKKVEQEALEKKAELLNKTENKILTESFTRIQKSVRDIEGKYRRAAALDEQNFRTELLTGRNQLVNRIFEAVTEKIKSFTSSENYKDFLINQIKNEDLEGAVVKISIADYNSFKDIIEKQFACNLEADEEIVLGGVEIFYKDKGIVFDKTFDNALNEQKQSFSARHSLKPKEH